MSVKYWTCKYPLRMGKLGVCSLYCSCSVCCFFYFPKLPCNDFKGAALQLQSDFSVTNLQLCNFADIKVRTMNFACIQCVDLRVYNNHVYVHYIL